jgi:hypothetical protein
MIKHSRLMTLRILHRDPRARGRFFSQSLDLRIEIGGPSRLQLGSLARAGECCAPRSEVGRRIDKWWQGISNTIVQLLDSSSGVMLSSHSIPRGGRNETFAESQPQGE